MKLAVALSVLLGLLAVSCSSSNEATPAAESPTASPVALSLTPTPAVTVPPETTSGPTASATPSGRGSAGTAESLVDDLPVRAGPSEGYPVVGLLSKGQEFEVTGTYDSEAWLAIPGTGWVLYSADTVRVHGDITDLPRLRSEFAVIGPLHLRDAQTGNASLDRVITAVLERDRDALEDLLVFQEIACVRGSDAGGPPHCPANVPEGTVLEVLPVSSESSAWFFADDTESIVDLITVGDDSEVGLYAVIELSGSYQSLAHEA